MCGTHAEGCCCPTCSGPPAESTSDTDTPDPPGAAGATKPVYSSAEIFNALTTGDGAQTSSAWAGQTITYSIGTGPLSFGQPYWESEYNGYVAMSAGLEAAAVEAFEMWDELIAIDLVELTDDAGADITFNYSSATGNSTYAERSFSGAPPGNGATYSITDSDLWFASQWWTQNHESDLYAGGYGLLTYLHEIGHALGLNHPGAYNGSGNFSSDATHFQDTRAYTVMSYFDAEDNGSGTDHFGTLGRAYGASPLLHDILAIQEIYGADMTTRTGSDTYGFNANTNRDAFDFTMNPNPVVAIWDAGGIDKIDVSGWNTNQTLSLVEGDFSSVGFLNENLAIAYGAVIEIGVTGGGNDLLIGNAAANVLTGNAGGDTLQGGEGNDILFGGTGGDVLDGGTGADTARYLFSTAGVTINLNAGTGSGGEAAGDSLISVEHVSGSEFADNLTGDPFNANQIFGLGGNDVITGMGGHDFLLGGAGNDHIIGGTGRDVIRGNAGADLIDGQSEDDWIQFNDAPGRIELNLGLGTGTVGDAAGDTYISIENIRGSTFDDVIVGSAGRNQILGDGGNDHITTAGGNDVVWGDGGNDTLIGSSAGETFTGGSGADQIDGAGGTDWAWYKDATSGVAVSLLTGTGTVGEATGDTLVNIEFLHGSEFDDVLEGSNAVNQIRGGAGADRIIGHKANDILEGFSGVDTFVFHVDDGIDRINNFEIGVDLIEITAVGSFSELGISNFKGEAAIAYDAGDVILLTGIDAGQVQASWFVFT
ncbi:MAG: M10 family metallopeptidase C-terminal domain-containing protein [Pseudomonadota bacterium]